jgi:RNA polymerase sigma factor (TIGR02999 family)
VVAVATGIAVADSTQVITRLLEQWREGDGGALDRLLPLVYDELRRLARAQVGDGATMQPTALVHETYLRFQRQGGSFGDRAHFFAAAALTMRRLLVDHARWRARQKRGGDASRVSFDEALHGGTTSPATEVLVLDEALGRLESLDERKARAVELHFFAGLTYEEIAEVLTLSPATVGRELRFAKAWLRRELLRSQGT